jgi:hypothetical protein
LIGILASGQALVGVVGVEALVRVASAAYPEAGVDRSSAGVDESDNCKLSSHYVHSFAVVRALIDRKHQRYALIGSPSHRKVMPMF